MGAVCWPAWLAPPATNSLVLLSRPRPPLCPWRRLHRCPPQPQPQLLPPSWARSAAATPVTSSSWYRATCMLARPGLGTLPTHHLLTPRRSLHRLLLCPKSFHTHMLTPHIPPPSHMFFNTTSLIFMVPILLDLKLFSHPHTPLLHVYTPPQSPLMLF